MLVVDVTFNEFKQFLWNDAAFFWTETTNSFVLLKPRGEMLVRTIVMKSTSESDMAFKVRELFRHTAKYCLNFLIDGQPADSFGVSNQKTEGQIFSEQEQAVWW